MDSKFWQEMRNEDFIVVDAKKRKIAVFPNTCGMVVLATLDDGNCITTIDVDEIDDLIRRLLAAKDVASPVDAELQALYAIHNAKESSGIKA